MKISAVDSLSVGEELGILPGDELISFDGNKVVDILDYNFYNESENFTMSVSRDGEITDYEIEKDAEEDLGLSFDEELGIRVCRNKCIFCFVDQLPKQKLRPTLKVKDDDYRFSFISGSYITLTNDTRADLDRMIRLHLSPLYVSIHSADNAVRRYMLGNESAPDVMEQLSYLHAGGIKLHAQIVYCPGVNDDVVQTVIRTAPLCESIAVVPVGLTKDCNTDLKPVSAAQAAKIIDEVERLQAKFLAEKGTRYVFLADEFYILAGRKVPPYECYEDFVQIENGVGEIALFMHDADEALEEITSGKVGKCTVATGVAAAPFLKEAAKKVTDKLGGEITVRAIRNDFFGESVTVAGLVTGGDIAKQLSGAEIGERLLLPRCMLKEFGDVFLDNMTVSELGEKLGTKIEILGTDGYSFVKGCARI